MIVIVVMAMAVRLMVVIAGMIVIVVMSMAVRLMVVGMIVIVFMLMFTLPFLSGHGDFYLARSLAASAGVTHG
jgi:hypothetical protein